MTFNAPSVLGRLIMNRHQRRLNELFNLACDHNPSSDKLRCTAPNGARKNLTGVVASIYIGNKLVSYGFNSRKTHPLAYRFRKNKNAICIHAEVDAIANALRRVSADDLAYSTMYIARAKSPAPRKPKTLKGLAKPCEGCARAIAAFRISSIYYTEDEKHDNRSYISNR